MVRRVLLLAVLAVAAVPASADATFPGRNGKIAFSETCNTLGCQDTFWTVRPNGSGLRELTRLAASTRPAFSPNGRLLALTWCCEESRTRIRVVRSDARGEISEVRAGRYADCAPAWSPTGRRVLFERRDLENRISELYLATRAGRPLRRIGPPMPAPFPCALLGPDWSSTDTIVFSHPGGGSLGESGLHMIQPSGRGLKRITTGFDMTASWSPRGNRIAFVRLGRPCELLTVRANGRGLRRLPGGDCNSSPAWSPDGRKLVFTRRPGLYVMNADGTGERLLAESSGSLGYYESAWQPLPR
jgi:TolB protein